MVSLPPDEHTTEVSPDSRDAPGGDSEAILVVDDSEGIRHMLQRTLSRGANRQVTAVGSANAAREALRTQCFDAVITDLSMPDEDGISLMQWAHEHAPGPHWIVLTGHGTLDAAVKALQLGAFDFIAKPMQGIAPLRKAVQNAIDNRRLVLERDRLTRELAHSNAQLREHVDQLEKACRLLEEQSETIQADLRRAALIQRALLPREGPDLPGFRVETTYRPCESVGGDLYDLVALDERHLALVIGDAAGHGLAAAMLAVLFHTRLPLRDREGGPRSPAEALSLVNRSLCEFAAPGLFLTAACAVLDIRSGALSVASAGHTPLFLQRRGGEVSGIYHSGPALGLYREAVFGQHELRLARGDRLWMHTDGLYDRMETGVTPPAERVLARLAAAPRGGPGELRRLFGAEIPSAMRASGDGPVQVDDVTLLMLAAEPGPSQLDNGLPPPLPPAPLPIRTGTEVLAGGDGRATALSVRGRADWSLSAPFFERCLSEIRAAQPLLLDLSLCEHMDSTFLGTIHELSSRADDAHVELRLQGVMPPVQALFDELGMSRVLERIVATMLPLPGRMQPLADASGDAHRSAVRVLRAHEKLANLSEANRREFDPLLEVLRGEVEAPRAGPKKVVPRAAARQHAQPRRS